MSWHPNQRLTPYKVEKITRELLHNYATVSLDKNPIHLDESAAQKMGFPTVIMHGMLSMAFLADYVLLHFPEKNFQILQLRTKFRKVTFPGDELTCEGIIHKIEEGAVTLTLTIKNQNGEVTTEGGAKVVPLSEPSY